MFKMIFTDSDFQGKYDRFFKGLYRRNRAFLIAAAVLFFAPLVIGAVGHFLSSPFDQYMTNYMVQVISTVKSTVDGTTLSLFINNSRIAFVMYWGGVFFGIIDIIQLTRNGLLFGFMAAKYPISLFYIVPHGIFEFSAIIISGAAGFRLLSAIFSVIKDLTNLKSNNVLSEQIEAVIKINSWKFRDSLTLFVVAIGLLVIAAIIEANITVALGNYIVGIVY